MKYESALDTYCRNAGMPERRTQPVRARKAALCLNVAPIAYCRALLRRLNTIQDVRRPAYLHQVHPRLPVRKVIHRTR
jgi:hypothetical protein